MVSVLIRSRKLQFAEFHCSLGERDGLLFDGLLSAIDDDRRDFVGVVLAAGRPVAATHHARHKHHVDIHHAGVGARQDFAKGQLHQGVGGVVSWLLSLHFRQSGGVRLREHDLAAKKQHRIEEGTFRRAIEDFHCDLYLNALLGCYRWTVNTFSSRHWRRVRRARIWARICKSPDLVPVSKAARARAPTVSTTT